MMAVWLWKYQQKPKLLALMDQHLPPSDSAQLRTGVEGMVHHRSATQLPVPFNFIHSELFATSMTTLTELS